MHFGLYVEWLYTQGATLRDTVRKCVEDMNSKLQAGSKESATGKEATELNVQICDLLCHLWVLGDFLLPQPSHERAAAHRRAEKFCATINFIICTTVSGRALRKWLIEIITSAQSLMMRDWLPGDVVFELLEAMTGLRDCNLLTAVLECVRPSNRQGQNRLGSLDDFASDDKVAKVRRDCAQHC